MKPTEKKKEFIRLRAGEVSKEQADKESLVLSNLLKAYEQVNIKAKLDELEVMLRSR